MPLNDRPTNWRALLPMLALLLTACGATLPPQPVPQPLIPPLPAIARQPTPPLVCSPNCSEGLRIELQSWQVMPTKPAQPAKPASGPMTR